MNPTHRTMHADTPAEAELLNPLAATFSQISHHLRTVYGKGDHHAAALLREIVKKGNCAFENAPEFLKSPRLTTPLKKGIRLFPFKIIHQAEAGGTLKFVTELSDTVVIESVIIPMKQYNTLCVSTQAGCRMGCRFCETARHGFHRNLAVHEITGQLFAARFILEKEIKNIVFMGMGEPFDNQDNLFQAIAVLNEPRGFDIALRHMTVSTCGVIPGIAELARRHLPQINLAVSVNSADDAVRSRLMPINQRYPLHALKVTLQQYPLFARRVIFIEYILIKGVNDSPTDAEKLIYFLKGLKVRVNLIGYNPPPDSPKDTRMPTETTNDPILKPVSDAELNSFAALLEAAGIFVVRRWARGRSLQAGCGQLSGNKKTKR